MKKRKAVVLYGSLTGNTEMVGKAMAEVLEEYGFETRCEKLKAGKDWSEDPVIFSDYDIVVLYNPADPTDFRVANNKSDYWGAWALMGVGLAMALLGLVFG